MVLDQSLHRVRDDRVGHQTRTSILRRPRQSGLLRLSTIPLGMSFAAASALMARVLGETNSLFLITISWASSRDSLLLPAALTMNLSEMTSMVMETSLPSTMIASLTPFDRSESPLSARTPTMQSPLIVRFGCLVTSMVLRCPDLTIGWPKNSTSSLYVFTGRHLNLAVKNLGWSRLVLRCLTWPAVSRRHPRSRGTRLSSDKRRGTKGEPRGAEESRWQGGGPSRTSRTTGDIQVKITQFELSAGLQ